MKKILILLFAVATISASANSKKITPANSVANLLAEFETHVGWSAVVPEWKDMRDKWGNATLACANADCVAKRMIEFESYTKWSDVAPE